MAAGRAGVVLNQNRLALWIGERDRDDIQICKQGTPCDYSEADAAHIFAQSEFSVHLDIGLGEGETMVLTGDLTHDYITINADYRS